MALTVSMAEAPHCLSMLHRLQMATQKVEDANRLRLKAHAAHNAGATSLHDLRAQGDLDLYDHDTLSQRMALRHHPRIVEILEVWWRAAKVHLDEDGDNTLDYEEYCIFHGRLVAGFHTSADTDEDVAITEEDARVALAEDWEADNRGDGRVDKEEFFDSVFQVCGAAAAATAAAPLQSCRHPLPSLFLPPSAACRHLVRDGGAVRAL